MAPWVKKGKWSIFLVHRSTQKASTFTSLLFPVFFSYTGRPSSLFPSYLSLDGANVEESDWSDLKFSSRVSRHLLVLTLDEKCRCAKKPNFRVKGLFLEIFIHRKQLLIPQKNFFVITADSPNRLGHSIMKLFFNYGSPPWSSKCCTREYLEHHGDE